MRRLVLYALKLPVFGNMSNKTANLKLYVSFMLPIFWLTVWCTELVKRVL